MKIGVMLRSIDERQGTGIYTRNLMDHLLPLDQRNEYVLFYKTKESLGRYSGYPNVREKLVLSPSKAIWDQVRIPLEAARERLDLIFHTKFTVPLVTKCKTLMTLHGSEWFVYPHAYKYLDRLNIRHMMPLYCKKADVAIANSDFTKRDFVKILGVDEKKIKTIYFGVDPRFKPVNDMGFLARVKEKYGLPDDFILFVGRIYPGKNFESLLQAFYRIHKRIRHKLVVAGHPRWAYESGESLIRRLGLDDNVHFTGWVPQEDLVGLYNLASVFVFPSFYESFGIAMLEALATGCPVIASNTGALAEIADGAAFLVDPFQPDEIAAAMRRVLTEDSLRESLIEKGLFRAKAFSWDRCARDTLALFQALN